MPARSKSTSTAASQSSIVLLEGYDALGAAIGSALRKFAPRYNVAVARSIQELKRLSDDLAPDLFIFDVDPPWRGLTDFLEELRDSHGGSRALVIGGAIPSEIAAERGSSGGLRFIEKPFDLSVFGAVVQTLVSQAPDSESRGTLRALGAIDLVLLHCAARASVILEIRSRARTGEIHIATGEVSHAETGNLKGEDALAGILSWPKTHTSERKVAGSTRRTIGATWPAIILEALLAEQEDISAPAPPPPKPVAAPKTGKKIVVVDDTEMLLIFVEDVLATAEPNWQITTAPNATEGLRAIEQVQPDLVLLDYNLPDFNGDELCRRLLQNERTASVPVLMMSGHIQQMNATAARFPNVVATIEKPFLSDALVDLTQRTLEKEHRFGPPIEDERSEPAVVEPEPELEPEPEPPPPPPPPPPPIPRQKKIIVQPPRPAVVPPPPPLAPVQSHIERHTPAPIAVPTIRVAPTDGNAAILGIFLEVVSMQLTSQLQMGAIRARPSSLIGSLRLESAATRSAIPSELGFQLGPAKLNGDGRISALRLIPTSKPFQPAQTRTAFEIGGVALIPNETRARVQLTPAGTTPMTMELFAHLELSSVELSASFQVAQLILNWNTSTVRVTLNPKAPEQTGAKFEMRVLKLDDSGRISELLLSPAR